MPRGAGWTRPPSPGPPGGNTETSRATSSACPASTTGTSRSSRTSLSEAAAGAACSSAGRCTTCSTTPSSAPPTGLPATPGSTTRCGSTRPVNRSTPTSARRPRPATRGSCRVRFASPSEVPGGGADRTYIEPLTPETVEAILERERPDAILPTVGGQTALNLAVELSRRGALDRLGIRLIGASRRAVELGEDRKLFKEAMARIGLEVPRSGMAKSVEEARAVAEMTGLPCVIRPSFTLGGTGAGIVYNTEELEGLVSRGLDLSPTHEVLIEESVIGWKEYELEVMRDCADNFVVICTIENFDPMGIHTGDSVTVAPAQTLTDREYQTMRDAARRVIREVGVETGGSNIQFAVDPKTGRMVVIEMNPRVSRSSALASKATGFPIAKIAALLAVGYRLHELPNDIVTKKGTQLISKPDPQRRPGSSAGKLAASPFSVSACFEPTID